MVEDPGAPFVARYVYEAASRADADAVWGSLVVEADDRLPNVEAGMDRTAGGPGITVTLRSADLGDLRAATNSFLKRIQAADGALAQTRRSVRDGSDAPARR